MTTSMRASRRIVAVLITTFLLLGLTYILATYAKKGSLEHLSSPANSKNECGPWAFFVAVTRQGIPLSSFKVKRELPITDTGVSFGDIVKQAKKEGFSTKLARLSWNELMNAGTPVILWVDGNHFLTVDPREAHPEGDDMMRVYDLRRPAEWHSRAKLKNRWTGESLVIRKSTSSFSRTGPKIRWETCFEDSGWVDPYEKKRMFKYAFENVGDKPLELSIAEVGCSCARADIEPKTIAPSEKGLVTVTVDVSEKRGYFSTTVLLNTNDPSLPKCAVRASGGVFQLILASLDTLYLGEVHRGTNLAESFYVHERGDKTLQIKDLKAVVDKKAGATEYISCEVKSTYIQAHNMPKNPVSRYRVKAGDYLVDLRLQISPDAPLGPFEGKVLVETNQPGRFSSGSVVFKGTVISDICAEPSAILLSRREPSVGIRLKSKLGGQVNIMALPVVSGDIRLQIEQLSTLNGEAAYRVSVAKFDEIGTTNGNLTFELSDKSSVAVPVVIYNGAQ
jgi:hypothetical protein